MSLRKSCIAALIGLSLPLLLQSCSLFEPDFGAIEPLDDISNPCFEADLLNGLSEEDPSELKAIFDCLNAREAFNGASGVVDALVVAPHRSGRVSGLEMAVVVNKLIGTVDLGASLQSVSDLIRERATSTCPGRGISFISRPTLATRVTTATAAERLYPVRE